MTHNIPNHPLSHLINNQIRRHGHVNTLYLWPRLLIEDSEGGLARIPRSLDGPGLVGGRRHPHVLEQLHVAVTDVTARRDQHAETSVHLERGQVVRDLAHRDHHHLLDVGPQLETVFVTET